MDVLEHIRARNEGHEDFFYMQNHHAGIVSREEYVRALIMSKSNRNSRYFNPSYEMRVIKQGLLSGFIPINCSFGGYDAGHYMGVCDAAPKPEIPRKAEVIHIEGCEIARAQEFGDYGVALTTISPKTFNFNKECTRLLPKTEYVELLIHPIERLLAVRKTTADNRNAIPWEAGAVSSAGFMPTLYELCGWCDHWKYRAEAVCLVKRSERILIFNLSETETIVCEKPKKKVKPQPDKPNAEEPVQEKRPPQTFKPASWLDNFGDTMIGSYLSCRQHHAAALSKWQTNAQAQPISGFENTVELPTEDSIAAVLAALEVCSA